MFIIWEVSSSRKLLTKKYEDPVYSVDWSNGNVVVLSHGNSIELLLWKYEKAIRTKGTELL